MPLVRVDDVEIHYEEKGQGEPLLMIQGLGYDHRPYTWLRDLLAGRFRTIAYDNRGVGRSSRPEGPYSIEMMAADASGLLEALSLDRAHVMGVSLGGYIGQMLALEHPGRVERLVLGCTYMTGDPERIEMPASTLALLTSREGTPEEVARRGLGTAFSAGFPSRSPEIFETLVRWRVEDPVPLHGYMAQLGAGMGFDVEDRVGSISSPVLIIHGDEDAVVPVERARELGRAIGGSRLEILEGAGHLFFIEEAARTADLVASFLGGA